LGFESFEGNRREAGGEDVLHGFEGFMGLGFDQADGFDGKSFGAAGGEEFWEMLLEFLPLSVGEFEAAFSAQGSEEGKSFAFFGGREDGDFDVDTARAFEIDLDKVGAAGGEDPDELATVTRVGHLLGYHGIDTARNAGVAGAGGAFSEGLVGFVDEDYTAVESVKEGENLFEVGLGGSDPAVAEVFERDDRNASFACEALGEVGFSGAHGAAKEVAHGHGFEFVTPPEVEIAFQPIFYDVEANDAIE
tara:strand:+ start:1499 stop:2242 length:744 start_codon:yes stop_codon:yes gene_type:complete